MASIIHGEQISFGAPSYNGLLVQSMSVQATSGKKEIADHTGEFAAIVYFQKKYAVRVQGYVTGSGNYGSVGAAATGLASASVGGVSPDGATYLDSVDATASNSDATQVSLSATAYDALS